MSRNFRHCVASFLASRACVRLAAVVAAFGLGLGTRPASAVDLLYVSLQNNTIVRYDISLSSASAVAASANVFVGTGQGLSSPNGLAFDSSGNLYVANASNSTITRYDSTGARIGTNFVGTGQGLNRPAGIAFDSSGNLYAANYDGNTITRYDPSGARIGTNFVGTGQGLSNPYGLAFDSSGNLYASNPGNRTVTRYNSSGTYINGAPFIGHFIPPNNTSLDGPMGLVFGTAGDLYVSALNDRTIMRFNSSGSSVNNPFVSNTNGAVFSIAFDSAGNLYAGDYSNSLIRKYDSSGVLQFTWSTGSAPLALAVQNVVPEPSTYVLGGLATGVMAVIARRRKARVNG